LIQRFGSTLNLNLHFHMLFLDGVYVERAAGTVRFRWEKAPTSAELTELGQRIGTTHSQCATDTAGGTRICRCNLYAGKPQGLSLIVYSTPATSAILQSAANDRIETSDLNSAGGSHRTVDPFVHVSRSASVATARMSYWRPPI
jgi:hypothetical protein